MKKFLVLAVLVSLMTPAYATDEQPKLWDQFLYGNEETILTVIKIKKNSNVSETKVCMQRHRIPSCKWMKIGELEGRWLIFNGVPQKTD